MPRSSDARQRFISTAARLFRTKGYAAVGLSEIIAAAEAPKGSFYHHFPGGKEELAEHALKHSGAQMAGLIAAAFAEAPDVATGAARFVATLAGAMERSDFTLGCPVAAMALDAAPASERLGVVIREVLAGWTGQVAKEIKRLEPNHPDPDKAAARLVAAVEGGWVVARVTRSSAALTDAPAVLSAPL